MPNSTLELVSDPDHQALFQTNWIRNLRWGPATCVAFICFLFLIFIFTLFYFTILYWFCHTLTWIHHGCTCFPKHEPPPTSLPIRYRLTSDCCSNHHRFYTALRVWHSFALSLWSFPVESTPIVRWSPVSKILKCKRSIFDWMKCCLALPEDWSYPKARIMASFSLCSSHPSGLGHVDLWSRDLLSTCQYWASLLHVLLGSFFSLFHPDKSLILRKQEMASKHLWIHWPIMKGAVGWC